MANQSLTVQANKLATALDLETAMLRTAKDLHQVLREFEAAGGDPSVRKQIGTHVQHMREALKAAMPGQHAWLHQLQGAAHQTTTQPVALPSAALTPGGVHTSIAAIGNPGTGKSTFLNCLIGRPVFQSGLSFGGGLTKTATEYLHGGNYYIDTPGLADQMIEKEAAQAIVRALKKGGEFKLLFFVRLESGRVVSDDLVTIQRVLDVINVNANWKFTVVINNLLPTMYSSMERRGEEYQQVLTLINSMKYRTLNVIFSPRIEALFEQDNAVAALPNEIDAFIQSAPALRLEPSQVGEIDTSDYRAMADQLREELEVLRRDKGAQQQMYHMLQQQFSNGQVQHGVYYDDNITHPGNQAAGALPPSTKSTIVLEVQRNRQPDRYINGTFARFS